MTLKNVVHPPPRILTSRCPEAPDGRHLVDRSSVHCDDCNDEFFVDVACALCRLCGSVRVIEGAIYWDDE